MIWNSDAKLAKSGIFSPSKTEFSNLNIVFNAPVHVKSSPQFSRVALD
jgi:hypothetical protein